MRKTNQPSSFWWWRWIHYQEVGELFQALGNLLHSIPISSFSALFENRNNLISIHLLINMIPWMLQETCIQEVLLLEVHFKIPSFWQRCWHHLSRLSNLFLKCSTLMESPRVSLWVILPVCANRLCAEGRCSQAVCLRADIRMCANNQPVKVLSFYLSGWIYTHGFSST